MRNLMASIVRRMDEGMERRVRTAAMRYGRRSFLTRLGALVVGGTLLPMLPFERHMGAAAAAAADQSDATKCEYWAYCSMNGIRCDACGGSVSQCPPGSQASVVSWVGTCTNLADKKAYLVSYNDCCGKVDCDVPEEAFCARHEGERPGYRIGSYDDANWCMANTNVTASCTVAVVIGIAQGA
jgi:methylamine dehydrogenase light chain